MYISIVSLLVAIAVLLSVVVTVPVPKKDTTVFFTTEEYNFLLHKEGYQIFFRLTPEGQLALVHPR